jgi:hypothetical protein
MKGLSSLERIILESIGWSCLSYEEIRDQTGLQENVCFNIIQALMIRGILKLDSGKYRVQDNLPAILMEELNGPEAKKAESLELMEALLDCKSERIYRFQKVALDARDEKIFLAMLSNLEMFLKDAHRKAESSVAIKDRKVIFWGMGHVNHLMNQVIVGGDE